MQVCFTCGAANPTGVAECESCGADMPGAEKATSSSRVIASASTVTRSDGGSQVCFTCGAANPAGTTQCQSCGSDMGLATPVPPPQEPPPPMPGLAAEINCPFCNVVIPSDTLRCPHCQLSIDAKDPLNQPAPRGHENNLTVRYEEFQKKVEAVRMASMSREDFATWLSGVRGSLETKRNSYIQTIRETGYYDFHAEEVDIGMNGILDFEEAIEGMVEFAEGRAEQSTLDAALLMMWQGNEKVNEAMRMNRGFRAQLEEDWGYM